MTKVTKTPTHEVPLMAHEQKGSAPILPRAFIFSAIALILCFSLPLYHWAQFALQSSLYSYVLLVPAVSIYLFQSGLRRPGAGSGFSRSLGVTLICFGGLA